MAFPEAFFQSLDQRGWAVSDHAIPAALRDNLRGHALAQWQAGRFRPAGVGRGAQAGLHPDIRGDAILWLDEDAADPASKAFFAWTDPLRQALNQRYYLGLRSQEFHFARYEPGHGYARHMDQHRGSRSRLISLVLYLNRAWDEHDGGELCLYSPEDHASRLAAISPTAGRVAVFRSDLIPHEVLPAQRVRWSLTGWFRNDEKSI